MMSRLRERLLASLHLRGVTEVGRGVRVLGRPRIDNGGRMRLGRGTVLRSSGVPVELVTGPSGELIIGDEVFIDYGTSIAATERVEIGDRVVIGPYTMIVDTDFHDPYARHRPSAPRPVRVEDDVRIGAKVSVLRGVCIGRGAVIQTGSVVNRDVPPFSVVAGVPARVVDEAEPLDPARSAS